MAEDPIELIVEPRPRDIGGFEVREAVHLDAIWWGQRAE